MSIVLYWKSNTKDTVSCMLVVSNWGNQRWYASLIEQVVGRVSLFLLSLFIKPAQPLSSHLELMVCKVYGT